MSRVNRAKERKWCRIREGWGRAAGRGFLVMAVDRILQASSVVIGAEVGASSVASEEAIVA